MSSITLRIGNGSAHLLIGDFRRLSIHPDAGQRATPEVLVMHVICNVLQVLQVRSNYHVSKGYEIAVLQILH